MALKYQALNSFEAALTVQSDPIRVFNLTLSEPVLRSHWMSSTDGAPESMVPKTESVSVSVGDAHATKKRNSAQKYL